MEEVQEIYYESARKEHIDEIIDLTDTYLGAGYFVRRYGASLAEDPSIDTIVALDGITEKVVGFIAVKTVDSEGLKNEFRMQHHSPTGLHGVLKVAAVHRDYQRSGIGWGLVSRAVNTLLKRGATHLWGSAWKHPWNVTPASPLLERLGMKQVDEIEDFWLEESREFPDYPCLECELEHGGECHCSAIIYSREIKGEDLVYNS